MRAATSLMLLICLLPASASGDEPTDKTMVPGPKRSAIVIDGVLGEPAWAAAPPRADFVERTPNLSARPPELTEVRVLADRTALYFGIICHDSQPDAIEARTLTRDSFDMFSDDAISVKLDPALDRRTTLGFALSAAGARMDYRGILEERWQVEFDGVWQGAVGRSSDGWVAEFRIPWSTLEIDADAIPERIGFDVSRDHARRAATYDWALLAPPYSPIAASQYGALTGLPQVVDAAGGAAPSRWAVDAYARGGFRAVKYAPRVYEATGGADIRGQLGAGLTGLLTFNTDFAQVEPDDQIVNLSQFDLFLPEKRDFFLNAGDLFELGTPGSAQLYYSRRIGLSDFGPVPIAGGVGLTGRPAPGLQVGLLDVITQPGGGRPWTSNLVARLQQDVGGDVALGTMLTHRQSLEDDADHNVAVGVDAAFRGASTPLLVNAYGLVTTSGDAAAETGPTATDGAAAVDVTWRGELVRPSVGYSYIGEDARSDLGFFLRTGVQQTYGTLEVQPRVESGGLETVTVTANGALTGTAEDFALLDWNTQLTTTLDFDAGYALTGTVVRTHESVLGPFPIGPETLVPAGEYDTWRGVLTASLPATWPVSFSATGVYGQFYDGRIGTVAGNLIARVGTFLRLQATTQADFARFDGEVGDFDSVTVNARAGFGVSPELGLDLFTGYGLLSDATVLQARLRWSYWTASDLFVVYELDLGDHGSDPLFTSLQLKLTAHMP